MRPAMLGCLLGLWVCIAQAEPVVLESGPQAVSSVELFTSEGCSSCPPAERWLSGLVADPGLWRDFAPMAWHVAYWNDLGWQDVFSSRRFDARQEDYRRAGALRVVYTPGVLVAGKEWLDWRQGAALPIATGVPGKLRIELNGSEARVRFVPGRGAGAGPWQAHLALLGSGIHTAVRAGENRGRSLAEDFVVLGWAGAPQARAGDAPEWTLALPRVRPEPARGAVVAWVQSAGTPAPVQVVGGWLR